MKNILVVMPFTKKWSNKVWDVISKIKMKDVKSSFSINRVDTRVIVEEYLDKQIEFRNKEADIIIADLTENNPNVLIEVGIALAINTPILLITQDRKWIPAHLGGKIVEDYDLNNESSIEKLISNMYFRIDELIRRIKAEENERHTKRTAQLTYNVECFSRRDLIGLELYFQNAKHRIDILTTNLSFLFEEYEDGRCYFDDICQALDKENGRKPKVRILTLNPESDFAAKRGIQLGYAPAVFRDALRLALKKTREIKASKEYADEDFEVRTYEDFPNQIMYRVDDDIFSCIVAQPTQSRNHVSFKLDINQAGVNNSFLNHFQNVWKDVFHKKNS